MAEFPPLTSVDSRADTTDPPLEGGEPIPPFTEPPEITEQVRPARPGYSNVRVEPTEPEPKRNLSS